MDTQPQKLTITNFSGKLTREIFGDINSGLSPFISFFGGVYPFGNVSYPEQLAFAEAPTNIAGAGLTEPILHFWNATNPANGTFTCSFGAGLSGGFYIFGNSASASDDNGGKFINGVGQTLYYNGGLFIGNLNTTATAAVAYVGNDVGVAVSTGLSLLASTWTNIGSGFTPNVPRPLEQFLGNLYAGDGNNIAEIITGNTVSTHTRLNPALPSNYIIRDMKVSNDGRYLVIVASFNNDPTNSLKITGVAGTSGNQLLFSTTDSAVILWNGVDNGYTSFQPFRGINLSSIVVSNTETAVFGKDDEGVGLWDLSGNRIVSIPETGNLTASYPPLPGQSYVLGKKIYFELQYGTTLYVFCLNREDNSLYCLYGNYAGFAGGEFIKGAITCPSTHATNSSLVDISQSKIYYSFSKIPISTQPNNFLYKQNLQNFANPPFQGYYSTQVQKFDNKIQVSEVWVYTQPNSSGVSFSVSLTGGSGAVITNSTNTYSYVAGTDTTQSQGALDLIKFPVDCKPLQALGVQVNNLGTSNPGINKIEVYYKPLLNPPTK